MLKSYLAKVGDTVTFRGKVVATSEDGSLLHFEGATVRIWCGDSRIIHVKSAQQDNSDFLRGFWHATIISILLWCLIIVGVINIVERFGHGH